MSVTASWSSCGVPNPSFARPSKPMAGERTETTDGTAGDAQLHALMDKANVGEIFDAAVEHRSIDGATRELQEHFGLQPNQIPLEMLREELPVETRAVTASPTSVGTDQGAIIGGVFPRAAAGWLHVDMPTVDSGDKVYPVLVQNAEPGTPAKSAEQAETTGSFSAELLSPSRIQAAFSFTREDAARFADMNSALRANLSEALGDKLDELIISGPDGLLGGPT